MGKPLHSEDGGADHDRPRNPDPYGAEASVEATPIAPEPFDWRRVASGEIFLGPGTTSMVFGLVLPYDCCAGRASGHPATFAITRRCGQCGALGWTHSMRSEEELRCLDCAPMLSERLKDRLILAGENP